MAHILEKTGTLAVGMVIAPLTEWQAIIQRDIITLALKQGLSVIDALTEAGF